MTESQNSTGIYLDEFISNYSYIFTASPFFITVLNQKKGKKEKKCYQSYVFGFFHLSSYVAVKIT